MFSNRWHISHLLALLLLNLVPFKHLFQKNRKEQGVQRVVSGLHSGEWGISLYQTSRFKHTCKNSSWHYVYLCWLVSIAVPPEDLTLCTGCVCVRCSHWSQTSDLAHRKWSVVKKINRMQETRKDFPAHYCTFHKEKETNKTNFPEIRWWYLFGFAFSTPCLNWENC